MKIMETMKAALKRNAGAPPAPGSKKACREAAHQICSTAHEQATITVRKARAVTAELETFLANV